MIFQEQGRGPWQWELCIMVLQGLVHVNHRLLCCYSVEIYYTFLMRVHLMHILRTYIISACFN